MHDYIKDFKIYLVTEKQASDMTINSYLNDVQGFMDFLTSINTKPYLATYSDIELYLNNLLLIGRASSTIMRNVASIRCYYNYLICLGAIDQNPAESVKLSKKQTSNITYLSDTELSSLLSKPDITTNKGLRDRAILEISYASGMKASELINLDLSDVNLSFGLISCCGNKNKRSIPIHKDAVKILRNYILYVRPNIVSNDNESALFVNLNNGKRITRQALWKIIKYYSRQANIEKDVNPHTLRHSFAVHLLKNGAAPADLQDIMGFSALSSLDVYLDIINPEPGFLLNPE
ncbi:MAG: tyrosine-type recombinase/integrase [Clostridia bacterium]|nr:tyrosine-type recombinase/integrase [Clostridia bacterium]